MKHILITLAACISLSLCACTNKTAEEKGKEMATEKVDMLKGIGDAIQEKGTAAAESLTTGAGKVVYGVERGIEKSRRTILVTETARQAGLDITKVQLANHSSENKTDASSSAPHGLDIYVISQKSVEGHLRVKALNAIGQEIARSKVDFKQDADEANYKYIPFANQVDLNAISKIEADYQPLGASVK